MKIYELFYSWYEEYVPYLFLAPHPLSEREWRSICDQMVPEAIKWLLSKEEYKDRHIGWSDIVERMVKMLEERKFTRVTPIQAGYFGANILAGWNEWLEPKRDQSDKLIPDPLWEKIHDHNRAIAER